MLRVHSIETFGTHDGPGIRLVVFLQGCQMRCVYCHNPDTQCMRTTASKLMSDDEILSCLEKQRPYMKSGGGLTVSGGEPTLQAKELIPLFIKAKASGFHIALDTNGALVSPTVHQLYDLTDLVILDVKHISDHVHRKLTGMTNAGVLRNAQYRENSGKPFWLRYVLVPGWTDTREDLVKWAKTLSSFTMVERVEILPYHTLGVHKYEALQRPYPLAGVAPPSPEKVAEAEHIFREYFPSVVVC